jgi:hypothetical protein
VEYRGKDGRMHHYSPDFLIRRRDGKCLIVEVKREGERDDQVDGERGAKAVAMRRWQDLNADRLKYHMVFVRGEVMEARDMIDTREFLDES